LHHLQRALPTEADARGRKAELKDDPSTTAGPGAAQKAFVLLPNLPVRRSLGM